VATNRREETGVVETLPPEPTFYCKAHGRWFSDEDPNQPLSAWSIDPVMFERKRTYCKRCDNANKAMYSKRKKEAQELEEARPPEDRQRELLAAEEKRLARLIAEGKGDSSAADLARYRIFQFRQALEADREAEAEG
jgi:hypothetical protein